MVRKDACNACTPACHKLTYFLAYADKYLLGVFIMQCCAKKRMQTLSRVKLITTCDWPIKQANIIRSSLLQGECMAEHAIQAALQKRLFTPPVPISPYLVVVIEAKIHSEGNISEYHSCTAFQIIATVLPFI